MFYLLHQFAQPRLAWFSQQSQLAALHEGYRWAARPPRQWPRASRPHGKAFVKKIFTHPWSSRCIVFSPSFWGPVPRKPSIGMRSQRLRLRCCSGRESTSVCSPYSIFSLPCSPHFLTFFIASPSLTPSRNNDRPLQFVAGNANTGEDVVLSVGRSGPNRTLTDSSAYSTVIEHPTAHVLKQTHASTTDDWGLHTHRIPADSEQPQCRYCSDFQHLFLFVNSPLASFPFDNLSLHLHLYANTTCLALSCRSNNGVRMAHRYFPHCIHDQDHGRGDGCHCV